MAVFYFACLGGQSVSMMPYRFGVLGWTPYQSFYFNSAKNVVDSATHGALVLPCLARFGSKRTFELGALCNAAACLVWSQSWRFGPAVGVASLRSTLFYAIGTALYSSLPAACPQSLRAVVIKQALVSCPDVGRAEVAAACECLDTPA